MDTTLATFTSKNGWLNCKYGKLSLWVSMWIVLDEKGLNVGLPTELALVRGITAPVTIVYSSIRGARFDDDTDLHFVVELGRSELCVQTQSIAERNDWIQTIQHSLTIQSMPGIVKESALSVHFSQLAIQLPSAQKSGEAMLPSLFGCSYLPIREAPPSSPETFRDCASPVTRDTSRSPGPSILGPTSMLGEAIAGAWAWTTNSLLPKGAAVLGIDETRSASIPIPVPSSGASSAVSSGNPAYRSRVNSSASSLPEDLSCSLTAASLSTHLSTSAMARNMQWDQWDNPHQIAGSYNETPRSILSDPEIEQKMRALSRDQSLDHIGLATSTGARSGDADDDDDDDGSDLENANDDDGNQMFSFDDLDESISPSTKARFARIREKAAKIPTLSFTAVLGLSAGGAPASEIPGMTMSEPDQKEYRAGSFASTSRVGW